MEKVACVRDKRQVLLDLIKNSAGSISEMACGDYAENSDKCDRLGKLIAPNIKQKYKSFLMILIQLLDSMEEFSLLSW